MRANATWRVLAGVGIGLLGGLAARPAAGAEVSVGAHGGVSVASLSITGLEAGLDTERVDGFDLGLRLQVGLGGRVSVLVTPQVVERGGALLEPAGAERLELRTRYLELPVLVRIAAREKGVGPYAFAGPSVAWRRTAELSLEAGGTDYGTEDIEADVEGVDVFLVAGAGVELKASDRVRFFAEGLWAQGLRGIDAGQPDATDFVDAKNRGFSLRGGFVVRLGR